MSVERFIQPASSTTSAVRWLLVLAFSVSPACLPAFAGGNAGATASLTWTGEEVTTDLRLFPASGAPLTVMLDGLEDISAIAVTIRWAPNAAHDRYYAFEWPESTSCGVARPASQPLTLGEEQFDWEVRFPVPLSGSQCITYGIRHTGSEPPTRATFWVHEVKLVDSRGRVDVVRDVASVAIGGGLPSLDGALGSGAFRELSRSSDGIVFWHGYRVDPPLILEIDPEDRQIWLRVAHVEPFAAMGLVRVPYQLAPQETKSVPPLGAAVMAEHRVDSLAREAYSSAIISGATHSIAFERLRQAYAAHPAIISSVDVLGEYSLRIVRAAGTSETITISPDGLRPRPSRIDLLTEQARQVSRALSAGAVVILRSNGLSTVLTGRDAAEFMEMMDALTAGRVPAVDESLLGDLRREMQVPREAIPRLLQRAR